MWKERDKGLGVCFRLGDNSRFGLGAGFDWLCGFGGIQ